jgi:nucleoside 2-deoxyribosyltransferase
MASVYVAGKFEDKEQIREVQRKFREAGFEISHDWTTEDGTGMEGAELDTYMAQCAKNDFFGVLQADFVVIMNHAKAFGTMTEMGLALAWGKPVYVVGAPIRDNIFFHLSLEEFGIQCVDSVEQAVRRALEDPFVDGGEDIDEACEP